MLQLNYFADIKQFLISQSLCRIHYTTGIHTFRKADCNDKMVYCFTTWLYKCFYVSGAGIL